MSDATGYGLEAGAARGSLREVKDLPSVESYRLIGTVEGFDEACARVFADPELRLLRSADGCAVVFRHADLRTLSANADAGNLPPDMLYAWALEHPDKAARRDAAHVGDAMRRWLRNQIFTTNEPLHGPERMIIARPLGPKSIAALKPVAQQFADRLISELLGRDEVDFSREVASRLSARLCGYLFRLTQEEEGRVQIAVHGMSQMFITGSTFDKFRAADDATAELIDLLCKAADRQLREPQDSLVKTMAAELGALRFEADMGQSGMVPENVGVFLAAHLFDAVHTTSLLSANTVYHLLVAPNAMRQVREEPGLVGAAVSEGARLAPPLANSPRYALRDIVYENVNIPAGSKLLMLWDVGNRDPEVFRDPNSFRLDRGVSREMAFGGGARICPGRYFARMLAEAAVRSVTASHIEISITTDENLWVEGSMLRQLQRLPVRLSKAR